MRNIKLNGVLIDKDNPYYKKYVTMYADLEKQPENAGKVLGYDEEGNIVPVDSSGGTSDYSELENKPTINGVELDGRLDSSELNIENLVKVEYTELKGLRDSKQLVPGRQYRITDYDCTTTQANTQSANHIFDIIVRADSIDRLNEDAYAIKHEGDTYFLQNNLSAWKLKYCLDNDTQRFAWADDGHGKGVIYYMKDEFNNEAPYDFKNIQILSGKDYAYTFGDSSDFSIIGISDTCHNNTIKPLLDVDSLYINMINILGKCCSVSFGQNCKNILIEGNCGNVQFGNGCDHISVSKVKSLADSVIFAGTKNFKIEEKSVKDIKNCHVFSCDYKDDTAVVDMVNFSECSIRIYRNNGSTIVSVL